MKFWLSVFALALVVTGAEIKLRGRVQDIGRAPTVEVVASDTPAPSPTEHAASASVVATPPCVLDWSLPVNADNHRAILSCYKQLYADPITGWIVPGSPYLCAPAGNPWESVFSSVTCWAINHGTPSALTATAVQSATAIGPVPTSTPTDTPTSTPVPYP